MRKRITSLLLTLVMLFSLVPAMGVTASAADDTFYEQVFIRNYRAFWDYLRSPDSRELVLDTNINYTLSGEDEEIEVRRSQRLDLNGHKIRIDATKRASFYSLITIYDGELTLYDSKGGGEIAVEFAMDSKEHSIIKIFPNSGAYPKFTMNSGTLTRLNPIETRALGSNGCVSDSINSRVKDGEPRPQITINGGTINCPYSWDRSKPLPIYSSQFMPTALLLRNSKLTVNGGTFNGMVWIEDLTPKKGETEPRIFLNGGVFNSSFVVEDVPKDVTRIIIDGARFNDGLYVGNSDSGRTYNVGSKPALLIKSGVFDSPDQKPKLDIYAAIGENTENAMKCFPNSAIKMNGKIYTSENLGLLAKNDSHNYFNSKTPIEVIGRAWDLKEVLLDGSPIAVPNIRDGAAFRKDGSVPVYTVSTLGTHELVYRWYDLAKELRDAGWFYEIRCELGPGLYNNIYNGSYTTANGICEWRYRLPNTPANIDAGQMAFTINLRHATDPTSIVYSNQYLLRYQVVQDSAQIITAGRLNMSGGDIIPSDAVSANQVTRGAMENRFTVSAQTNWSLSGDTRSKTVTLKAADGYRFLSASDFSVEGANCVTAKSSSVSADGKTCKVRVEARVCRLLTHIAGELENFYDDRTFADVSITSYDPDRYRFEIDGAVERSYSGVSPFTKIDGSSWYYFFLDIYPEPGYAVRSNSKVAVFISGGYWSNGSAMEDEVYTAIYGDWVADDVGHTVYPKCWCIGRDAANTEYVGIDPRYESAARTLRLGIKMPVAGESPTDASYQSISGLPSDVKEKIEWKMQGDTVFQAGKEYELEISLEIPKQRPNTVWPEDYKTTVVYINGVNAWTYDDRWGGPDGGKANAAVYNWGALIPYTVPGGNDGVTVSGKITSYNPGNATTVELRQGDTVKYSTTITKTTGSGQVTQNFTIPAVAAGTYDLVVTKPGHLPYTVTGVVVGSSDLDLTTNSKEYISTMTLLAGDVDGDGNINETDVSIIRYASNINKDASAAANPLTDMDGDGSVNESDVSIVRYSTHINKSTSHCTYGYAE